MTTTKRPAKKAAPRKTTARKTVKAVPDPDGPPLDAVATPPKAPRKRTPNTRRRGATAPPGPADLVKLREREMMALGLAAAGVNDWDKIAEMAGFETRAGAWKAVQRVLHRQEFAAVADYRRLIGFRYEQVLRANWEATIARDESPAKDKATPRVLRALEGLRRVFGVDLEAEKLAEALRIPADPVERQADLAGIRDELRGLKVVGGTDID